MDQFKNMPVTENGQAQHKSQEYAAALAQTMFDALLVLDGALRVQMANSAFYETFGLTTAETEGTLIYELDGGQWQILALRTLLEDLLPEERFVMGYEVEHEFEEGRQRTLLFNGRQLEHQQKTLLVIADITQRKRAERALRESENLFTTFLEQLPLGVGMFNKQRQWIIKNPVLEEMVGDAIPSYDVEAQPQWRSWAPDGSLLAPSQWPGARAMRGETVTPGLQFLHTRQDGSEIWVRVGTTPFRNDAGEITGVIAMVDDITERRRHVQQLRANEARQRFLLELGDALRNETDARTIMALAAERLGRHLHVDRAGYAEFDPAQNLFTIQSNWSRSHVTQNEGGMRLDEFGSALLTEFQAGRTLRIDDTRNHPLTADASPGAYATVEVRAGISVPLVKGGEFVALFYINQREPRRWTDEDEAIAREVAERTWAAVQRARAEEALRQSEMSYRTLFESINEGFCVFEMLYDEDDNPIDYRWLETNPAFEQHTGLKDAVGKTARELVPGLEQYWVDIYGRIASTGQREQFISQSAAMNRWFEVDGFRVGDPQERKVALLFNDVTQRKQAEETLRKSEHRLQMAISAVSGGIYEYTLPMGEGYYLSSGWAEILGYRLDELPSKEHFAQWLYTQIHPDDVYELEKLYERMNQGIEEGSTHESEVRLRHKEGHWVWVNGRSQVLERDEAGRVTRLVGLMRDITERKQAEEQLQAAHAQTTEILESIRDAFYAVDHEWRITYVNRRAEQFWGRCREELLGQVLWDLFPNSEETERFHMHQLAASERKPASYETHHSNLGRWTETHIYPSESGLSVYFRDITDRKQAEEALRQMNESLEEQVEERTHQVRDLVTQLTTSEQAERHRISQLLHDDLQQRLYGMQFQLKFLHDALGESPGGEDRQEAMKSIAELDRELLRTIQETRNLSVELSPLVLEGEGLIEAVGWLAAKMERQYGLTVHIQATDDVPVPETGLRVLLFQNVRELLFNIVKHARVQEAVVSLSRTEHQIRIEVCDRGVGFDVDAFLSDPMNTHGLLQSLRRLELVGGHMEITSDPQKGTRVRLTCPLTYAER